MKLAIGIILVFSALGSSLAELFGLKFPTISWGFNFARSIKDLKLPYDWMSSVLGATGWITVVVLLILGLWLILGVFMSGPPNPVTVRKVQRFKEIKRGYYSFLILIGLGVFAGLDQLVVGNEALYVRYDDETFWPAFTVDAETGEQFGVEGDFAKAEPNYRELKQQWAEDDSSNSVVLPLWPYGATRDAIDALAREIDRKDGLLVRGGEGYDGLATRLYAVDKPARPHLRFTYRDGVRNGVAQGWDQNNDRVFKATYVDGKVDGSSIEWTGEGTVPEFFAMTDDTEYDVSYPPSEPTWATAPRHPLGTTSEGYDVLSYLYGGLQVNFQAALIYIPVVYLVGITIGLLMGFFGGTFDLIVQRLIEILSNIPFLFLVIIISLGIPAQWKDVLGFYFILAILAIFGWMGMTYLMRTAALKEKARDYIAASRVLGASTPRILFRHLLPNTIAILVTLVPFSVSGLVLSLTSLDYLGFGLPVQYASWGKLLRDGLQQLSSPWLATSAFVSLVILLLLVTFVGEAIREAFDPKKYTYYR